MVSVLVPRSPGSCPHRDANWSWLTRWWAHHFPGWQVVEGESDPDHWSKAAAASDALSRAEGDVLVVADADVFCDPPKLVQAAEIATDGWVVPFVSLRRLNRAETYRLTNLDPGADLDLPTGRAGLDRAPQSGRMGGGLFVVTRDQWETVGGFDPAFTGWGGEDVSVGWALNTLAGRRTRLKGPLWHLWHPRSSQRGPNGRPTAANKDLANRYRRADGKPEAMRQLIDERTPADV